MFELWYGPEGGRRHVKRNTMDEIDEERGFLEDMGIDDNVEIKETSS